MIDMQDFHELMQDDEGLIGGGAPLMEALRGLMTVDPVDVHDEKKGYLPLGVWSGWSM